jgi:SAM-dependent methyltransferase
MAWFSQWFGEDYLLVYDHRNEEEAERDVDAVERVLELQGGERILDLCCGGGRHALSFARRGYTITGLDYSATLLNVAKCARGADDRYPLYVRGDARNTPFRDGTFDIVVNLFTSFGYFGDAENAEMIVDIRRLLGSGGRFYMDYLNPPRILAGLVPESRREKNDTLIVERRCHVPETCRVEKTIMISRPDGEEREYRESVRLYERDEMERMIADAGLNLLGVLGSADGAPYDTDADRMILFGTAP